MSDYGNRRRTPTPSRTRTASSPTERQPVRPAAGVRRAGLRRRPTGFDYAGWPKRVGAYLVDGILHLARRDPRRGSATASSPARPRQRRDPNTGTTTTTIERRRGRHDPDPRSALLTGARLLHLEHLPQQGRTGYSIGKGVLGIKLVRSRHRPADRRRHGVRALHRAHPRRDPLLPRLPVAAVGLQAADVRRQGPRHGRGRPAQGLTRSSRTSRRASWHGRGAPAACAPPASDSGHVEDDPDHRAPPPGWVPRWPASSPPRGHDLALCARRLDRLEELRAEILAAHPDRRVEVRALDVNDDEQVFAVFRAFRDDFAHASTGSSSTPGLGKGAPLGTGGYAANRRDGDDQLRRRPRPVARPRWRSSAPRTPATS